jgi:MFS transporter, FHS family, glucose/mannose:H+ symporter
LIKFKDRLNNYYLINNAAYSLIAVSLCKFLYGFYTSAIGSILVPIGERFDINIKIQSIIFPFNYFGQIVIIFFVGYFADRLGKKAVQVIFLVLLSLFSLIFWYSDNFYLFLILFMFMGLFGVSINTIADAAVSDTFKYKKGYYLNIAHVFFGLGALTSPIIFNLVYAATEDFRTVYFVLFIISAVIVFLVIAARYPSVNDEKIKPAYLMELIRNPRFLYLCIFGLLSMGSVQSISGWIPTLFQKFLGVSSQISNYSPSFFWMAIVAGRIITAFLSKKYRALSLLKVMNIMLFFILSISFFLQNPMWLLADYMIFGVLIGGIFPLIIAYSAEISPRYSTTRIAVIFSFTAMGMFLMPTLTGLLSGYFAIYKIISAGAVSFLAYIYIFEKKFR